MKCKVISPLDFDGKRYKVGKVVDMTAEQAAEAKEAVEPLEEKQAEDKKAEQKS